MSIQKLSNAGITGGKFKSVGFVTNKSFIPVESLVVAGGGSGQGHLGEGGGAGGYRSSYQSDAVSGGAGSVEDVLQVFSGEEFTVTVGAGGAQPSATQAGPGSGTLDDGDSGNDSVFSSITSIGGGKGNAQGGSNGGGAQGATSATGQGFPGGPGGQYRAGAGGGASAAGGGGTGSTGDSPGGAGVSSSITGSAATKAGGGGGGRDNHFNSGTSSGGSGGGGQGRSNNVGSNGSTNTGGGAGGGGTLSFGQSWRGGAGGSGVVILRYPDTYSIGVGAGLTASTATDGSSKVTTFTAGTGTVSFS